MIKLLMLLFLLPMTAFAETKGGGGGIVVACYDKEGELTTVELLDLYEAKAKGNKIDTFSGNFEQDISKLAKKIRIDESSATQFSLDVSYVVNSYKLIPENAELELTNDAFPAFLPKGCKAKQVANYYNAGLIWIDGNLFEKMSYVDQLALAVHEALYAMERMFGVTNSRYTRTIVGHAFSSDNSFSLPVSADTTHFCSSGDDAKVIFYASKDVVAGNANVWKFYFTHLNGHKIYSQKTGSFFMPEYSVFGRHVSGNPNEYNPDLMHISTSVLSSKINGNELMGVKASSNELLLTWNGTDPGDSFRDVEVRCMELP